MKNTRSVKQLSVKAVILIHCIQDYLCLKLFSHHVALIIRVITITVFRAVLLFWI